MKMKTNRLAHKKFRVNAKGKPRHARAGARHFTGKKSSKRMRHLDGTVMVDKTMVPQVLRQLPYARASK